MINKGKNSLISAASTVCTGGNRSRTMQNDTHATAMMPIGMYHLPRVNGPGTSLSRPDVMRKKMGAAYDVYRPMTAELEHEV